MVDVAKIKLSEIAVMLVEVDDTQLPDLPELRKKSSNMPPGTEEVGTADHLIDALTLVRENLDQIFTKVSQSVERHQPDEWGVELNIGFKGKANPVPVLLSGEANAALKIHAMWKKSGQ